ncbi:MAG: hypothetical protein A2073_03480 [Deltaproteobacteria bacterium GWC2_42_11]|nr:MAG: hypothetical protein A2073_03480 [Deltaproteobacteria bacterium GWC2_42_11]HBO84993.1 hypothetical protein [Deltaproteobacteria bacterium]
MNARKSIITVISLFVMLFLFSCVAEKGMVTAGELHAMIKDGEKDMLIIDVRTPAEFNKGYISGAINIPVDKIAGMKDFPYKSKVVLYCTTGVRSFRAKKLLAKKGITDILDLEGGINAWVKNGGEVITPQKTSEMKQQDKVEEEYYSGYPENFVVPKGVCEQGIPPAMEFKKNNGL